MVEDLTDKHGTTTLGMVCSDGVVMAAERRATMGYMVANKNAKKLIPITDSIVMSIAGSVGDAQMLAKYLRSEIELYELRTQKKATVKATSALLANILFGNRMSFNPFWVEIIIGGKDSTGYYVFDLDAGGSNLENKVVSTGSGSPFAYGVLETEYKEGIKCEEGIKIAVRALKAAMARDIASGEGMDIIVINDKGINWVPQEKIQEILAKK